MSILFAAFLQSHSLNGSLSRWTTVQLAPSITISAPSNLAPSHETPQDPRVVRIDDWGGKIGNRSYIASVTTTKKISIGDANAILSATAIQGVSRPNSAFTKIRDITVSGWAGVAISVNDGSGMRILSRTYRVDQQIVTLALIAPESESKSPEVERYLGSLHVQAKGPTSVPGPELSRYPLGSSGLTAMFPHAPTNKDSRAPSGAILHSSISDFASRSFMATYQDLPKSGPKLTTQSVTSSILIGFRASNVKSLEMKVGKESGLRSDFAIGTTTSGSLLVYRLGKRMISLLSVAPKVYQDGGTIKRFFGSVK